MSRDYRDSRGVLILSQRSDRVRKPREARHQKKCRNQEQRAVSNGPSSAIMIDRDSRAAVSHLQSTCLRDGTAPRVRRVILELSYHPRLGSSCESVVSYFHCWTRVRTIMYSMTKILYLVLYVTTYVHVRRSELAKLPGGERIYESLTDTLYGCATFCKGKV